MRLSGDGEVSNLYESLTDGVVRAIQSRHLIPSHTQIPSTENGGGYLKDYDSLKSSSDIAEVVQSRLAERPEKSMPSPTSALAATQGISCPMPISAPSGVVPCRNSQPM